MSWGLVGAAAIMTGGAMAMDGGGKGSKIGYSDPAGSQQARKWLMDLLYRGTPTIPVKPVTEETPLESEGQKLLKKYIGTGEPTGVKAGTDELLSIISGEHDPRTSPLYKGFRQESLAEEERGVNLLRQGQQLRGAFTGTPGAGQEAKLRRGFSSGRQTLLGGLYETERGKVLPAINQLLPFMRFPEETTIKKLGAVEAFGSTKEQERADAAYNALMQKVMFPYTTGTNIAGTVLGNPPSSYATQPEPSTLSQVTPLLQTMMMMYGMKGTPNTNAGGWEYFQ